MQHNNPSIAWEGVVRKTGDHQAGPAIAYSGPAFLLVFLLPFSCYNAPWKRSHKGSLGAAAEVKNITLQPLQLWFLEGMPKAKTAQKNL